MMVAPEILRDPSTLAVVKHYAWRDYGGFCLSTWGRPMYRHVELMRLLEHQQVPPGPLHAGPANAAVDAAGCQRWPDELRRKFLIATPQWLTVRRGSTFPPLKDLLPVHQRPVDVAFAGTTNYSEFGESKPWQQQVSRHREAFLATLRAACKRLKLRAEFFTSPAKKAKFFDLLRRTKLFVSPWGLGEWSGKDEEAILSGAVLVKPGASIFESAIPMYEPGKTCLDARPDGADLGDVLAGALARSNMGTLEQIQARAHASQRAFVSYGAAVKHEAVLKAWASVVRRAQEAVR